MYTLAIDIFLQIDLPFLLQSCIFTTHLCNAFCLNLPLTFLLHASEGFLHFLHIVNL
jgi:hypothetical protein